MAKNEKQGEEEEEEEEERERKLLLARNQKSCIAESATIKPRIATAIQIFQPMNAHYTPSQPIAIHERLEEEGGFCEP